MYIVIHIVLFVRFVCVLLFFFDKFHVWLSYDRICGPMKWYVCTVGIPNWATNYWSVQAFCKMVTKTTRSHTWRVYTLEVCYRQRPCYPLLMTQDQPEVQITGVCYRWPWHSPKGETGDCGSVWHHLSQLHCSHWTISVSRNTLGVHLSEALYLLRVP